MEKLINWIESERNVSRLSRNGASIVYTGRLTNKFKCSNLDRDFAEKLSEGDPVFPSIEVSVNKSGVHITTEVVFKVIMIKDYTEKDHLVLFCDVVDLPLSD